MISPTPHFPAVALKGTGNRLAGELEAGRTDIAGALAAGIGAEFALRRQPTIGGHAGNRQSGEPIDVVRAAENTIGAVRHSGYLPCEPSTSPGDDVGAPSIPGLPQLGASHTSDAIENPADSASNTVALTRCYYNFDATVGVSSYRNITKDSGFGTRSDLSAAFDNHTDGVFDVGQYPGLPQDVCPAPRGADALGQHSGPAARAGQRAQPMIRIPCPECAGSGRWTCDGGNNPSARLYECEQCGGDGLARCCECDDGTPATTLRCVDCTPPLSMPLCARHAAEYAAEELV